MIFSTATAGPGGNTGVVAHLLEYLARLLAPHRLLFYFNEATTEAVVSRHGAVEIRETHARFAVQTCVKGDPDPARATALQRITRYLAGSNRVGTRLRAAGPLVQREDAPGRWLVRVELSGVKDVAAAAPSRNPKVRIRPAQPEVLAVLRMSGCPTLKTIARGNTVIHAALAGTIWMSAGGPMIRLYRPPSILPFVNHFEVAVPIARRSCDTQPQRKACGDAVQQSPAKMHPAQECSNPRKPRFEHGNTLSQPRCLDLA